MNQSGEKGRVSVIMTVYNGEEFLQEAIDSVLNQTLPDFEFVIVDDGSTDGSPEILRKAQADPRVTVIRELRIGRAQALNTAWRNTTGEFIANLDADDVAAPTRLEKQVEWLEAHPEISMLATDCKVIYSGYPSESGQTRSNSELLYSNEKLCEMLVSQNPIHHSSVMLRRNALEAVDGYDDRLQIAIDYDLWVRLGVRFEMAVLGEQLTTRRIRKTSFFHKYELIRARQKNTIKIRWIAWQHFSKKVGDLRYVLFEPLAKWGYIWIKKVTKVQSGKGAK